MKLSEMTTDQMAAAMCELADPIERICKDNELNQALKKLSEDGKSGMTVLEKMGRSVAIWLPTLLNTHKADVFKVLSVLTGKTVEEIGNQKGTETMADVKACIDGDLMLFFKLFAGMA